MKCHLENSAVLRHRLWLSEIFSSCDYNL